MNCVPCAVTFTRSDDVRQHAACEEHTNQTSHHYFSCLPCSLPLHTISEAIQHIDSEEHSIMALAADNSFDTQEESHTGSFPPLCICMLCGCRDGNPYGIHLKTAIHKNIARLMRAIYSEKTIHFTNDGRDAQLFEKLRTTNGPVYCELCDSWSSNWYNFKGHLKNTVHVRTQKFMNKLINIKQCLPDTRACDDICYSLPYACDLCNLYFSSHEYYKKHVENQTHERVELFMTKMSDIVRSMDVVIRSSDLNISETFSNSLDPLYYCELCDNFCFKFAGYVQHKEGFIHKRLEELFSKLTDKRKGNVIRLSLRSLSSAKHDTLHYCKLCIVGFLDVNDFSLHLEDKGHLRIEHFINGLTNEGDKNFIIIYISAQIQTIFGESPPNYCGVCNILHSKSDKYQQHLDSKEHKQAEQSHPKKDNVILDQSCGENSSKRLKNSHPLSFNQTAGNVQCSSVITNSSMEGVLNRNEPLMSTIGFAAHETNSSYPSLPITRETHTNRAPWFEANATNNYPTWLGYQHPATYMNYSSWHCFQPQETYHYYPPWPGFQAQAHNYRPRSGFQGYVLKNNYPPWSGFQARLTYTNYPPSPGFQAYEFATDGLNLPRPGFEACNSSSIHPPGIPFGTYESNGIRPPGLAFEALGTTDLYPPGTEVLETNTSSPPEHEIKDNSTPQLSSVAHGYSSEEEHYCELCDFHCSNSRHYEKHLKGEKHKRLRKLLNKKDKKSCLEQPIRENTGHPLQYNCELCDSLNRNAEQYELHLDTVKHRKNQWLLYVLMQRPL